MSDEPEVKPSSDLQADLRDAIEKHLPAETSGLLRERLDTLTKIETERPELKEKIAQLQEERETLERDNQRWKNKERTLARLEEALDTRETECTGREEKCRHRKEVIDLKESHAKERVEEMRSVVKDVFGNNRFKYREQGTVPVPVEGSPGMPADGSGGYRTEPMSGHVGSGQVDRTVEGEGDVPSGAAPTA